jgi:hypothetical protein
MYEKLKGEWSKLINEGIVEKQSEFPFLQGIKLRIDKGMLTQSGIEKINMYIDGLPTYTKKTAIDTVDDLIMRNRILSATWIGQIPFAPIGYEDECQIFGIDENYHNNIRDILQDIPKGRIFYPNDVRKEFGITGDLSNVIRHPTEDFVKMN